VIAVSTASSACRPDPGGRPGGVSAHERRISSRRRRPGRPPGIPPPRLVSAPALRAGSASSCHAAHVGLQPRSRKELVAGWWEHARLAQGSRQQRKSLETGDALFADAGWYGVDERVERGGVQALELVAALLEHAPDDDGIALVAAGPLEDLLHRHGQELVDEIERWARQDPRFGQALAGVWLADGALDPTARARLRPWLTTGQPE
jgi:hypothetical protein